MASQGIDSGDRSAVLGLTIGSFYSSVAIVEKDGRANVIADEDGIRLIPTCVAFRNGQIFAGTPAHNQALRNAENSIYGFFDLLGNSTDSELVKYYKEATSNKITEKNGSLAYEVQVDDKSEVYTAHEIAVHFLKMLKDNAEAYMGLSVTGTVLAVPTYYTDKQRAELIAAGNEAGLKVEQVANEPSLALLAYDYLDHDVITDKSVIVVDFGARSLDVTLMSAKQGVYTTLATENNREVSGFALDEVLVQHFAKEFKTKNKVDITDNKRALLKLRAACELTKKTLSSAATAPCSVESLAEGIDYHANVNRLRFELLSSKVLNKVVATIEKVLSSANYHATDIDEVILIGGGSRIPKLQSAIQYFFPENTLIRSEIESDEVVSRGCVLQASLLKSLHETEDVSLEKLVAEENLSSALHTTSPIGFVDGSGSFVTVVPVDTPLPVRRVFRFSQPKGQDSTFVALCQGVKEAVTIQPETPAKEEDDEEEPETPEPITTYQWKAGSPLAELGLTGLDDSAKPELQVQVDAASKLTVILRDLASGQILKVES